MRGKAPLGRAANYPSRPGLLVAYARQAQSQLALTGLVGSLLEHGGAQVEMKRMKDSFRSATAPQPTRSGLASQYFQGCRVKGNGESSRAAQAGPSPASQAGPFPASKKPPAPRGAYQGAHSPASTRRAGTCSQGQLRTLTPTRPEKYPGGPYPASRNLTVCLDRQHVQHLGRQSPPALQR